MGEARRPPGPPRPRHAPPGTVGHRIFELRTARGKTIRQVEDACGLSRSLLRSYEMGDTRPGPVNLRRLARLFGVTEEHLETGAPDPTTVAVEVDAQGRVTNEIPGCCHLHGVFVPYVRNPHPDAGQSERLLDVGTKVVCIPCIVALGSAWARRALAAEARIVELEEGAEA